ncbi:MAG: sulfotransferase family 2 domain-containing protein [Pseudomonadota bacterium]
MIISTGRRYVFVHMPKTGGTSLALALEQRAMKDDILLGDTPKAIKRRRRAKSLNAKGRLWKHSTLADIDGVLSTQAIEDMFVFTLVRNPWDRIVSYYHWLRTQSFDHPDVARAQELDFEGFVLHTATLRTFHHNPARTYVTMSNGIEKCDAFIRLEYFNEDSKHLVDHLGFELALPHLNRSDRDRDYCQYYVAKTREAVARACAEDIQRFGYQFDGFA